MYDKIHYKLKKKKRKKKFSLLTNNQLCKFKSEYVSLEPNIISGTK